MRTRGIMKKKIALIFGGKSVERDISVITAVQTYKALDDKKYAITPIFIFEGDFYTGNLKTLKDFAPFVPSAHKKLALFGGTFCQVKKNKLSKTTLLSTLSMHIAEDNTPGLV